MQTEHVNYDGDTSQIVRTAPVAEALAQRYPRAIRGVADALSLACVAAFSSVYTPLALAAHLSTFLVCAEGQYRLERRRERLAPPEPTEEIPYPVAWFEQLCDDAMIPTPIVKSHWPTAKGHAFRLAITGWVMQDGRHVTVETWLGNCALLHDVAGPSCTFVRRIDKERVGGIATIEFEGIKLEEPEPLPIVGDPSDDPASLVTCSIKGCHEQATHHVVDPATPHVWVCVHHVEDTIAHLGGFLDWHEFDADCYWGRCTVAPVPQESDRECTPDSDPLLPLRILGADPRKGSEGGQGWLPPDGPALPPPRVRPPGAVEGSKGGRMFDRLVSAQGPLTRGFLAAHADLSPTTAHKLLTAWADLGVVDKIGQLWQVTPDYSTSASVIPRGSEDDAGE